VTLRTLISLTIVAVISLAAAGYAYYATNDWSDARSGGPLFPDLPDRGGEVAEVVVERGDTSVRLVRSGSSDTGWALGAEDGYPVEVVAIRELLTTLSGMETIEPKTRLESRYELLDLDDPKRPDGRAKRVTLRDASGNSIADLIVGKTRYGVLGPARNATYVRKPDDPQTWLASGQINAQTRVADWVDSTIYAIEADQLSRVTIRHPDGETVVLQRKAGSDSAGFELADLPDGATLKKNASIDFAATSLAELSLEDVRKAPPGSAGETATEIAIEAKTGLELVIRLLAESKDGGAGEGDANDYWVTVAAAGDGEAQKEAEAINHRVAGWQYRIARHKGEALSKRLSDFVEVAEASPEEDSPPFTPAPASALTPPTGGQSGGTEVPPPAAAGSPPAAAGSPPAAAPAAAEAPPATSPDGPRP